MVDFNFYTLDVFTETQFGGNQLAVVMDADGLSTEVMQQVAREFNLSETVFVCTPENKSAAARLRIFTPGKELPFAGHPIVGTAILLAETAWNNTTKLRLEVPLGAIDIRLENNPNSIAFAEFTAPVVAGEQRAGPSIEELAMMFGLAPEMIGFDGHQPGQVNGGVDYLFVPVVDRSALAQAAMEQRLWRDYFDDSALLGAFIYCAGGENNATAYRGRMLSDPATGIGEDPATGSCASAFPGQLLAAKALQIGTNQLQVEQGYEMGRPSLLFIGADVDEDNKLTNVRVGGHAIKVSSGQISIT